MDAQKLMTQYWKHIAEQNAEKINEFFHEDAYVRWHCTNENFTVSEFLRANCEYPGDWNGDVERIDQIDNMILTVTRVWSNEMSFHVVSFFKLKQDKIVALDEYWADDGEAPQWRLDLNIGNKIY